MLESKVCDWMKLVKGVSVELHNCVHNCAIVQIPHQQPSESDVDLFCRNSMQNVVIKYFLFLENFCWILVPKLMVLQWCLVNPETFVPGEFSGLTNFPE